MRLSISNIGWDSKNDEYMYDKLAKMGYAGIEIAPTRIFAENPYNHIDEALEYQHSIKSRYNLDVSSMQSIWYGHSERLFGTDEERGILLDYTKKAIRFAEAMNCRNLVFGCPRNRMLDDGKSIRTAIDFFSELGIYAVKHHTVLAMEANPTIYHTNFINTTKEACDIVRDVSSDGFKVNLDLGTVIQNEESLKVAAENLDLINHVHISEPYLKPIQQRTLHKELRSLLDGRYEGFVSIEMGMQDDISIVEETMRYIGGCFG